MRTSEECETASFAKQDDELRMGVTRRRARKSFIDRSPRVKACFRQLIHVLTIPAIRPQLGYRRFLRTEHCRYGIRNLALIQTHSRRHGRLPSLGGISILPSRLRSISTQLYSAGTRQKNLALPEGGQATGLSRTARSQLRCVRLSAPVPS
jgi:hypothetical protein